MRARGDILVLAYAVMPDHLHLLLAPQGNVTLVDTMKHVKSFSARRINERVGERGSIWQQSYYDRVIRNETQLYAAIEYIHRNPVEDGLVHRPEDYVFSSAHPGAEVDIEAFFDQAPS
jgi:REP element-mobilizing transposase RayT